MGCITKFIVPLLILFAGYAYFSEEGKINKILNNNEKKLQKSSKILLPNYQIDFIKLINVSADKYNLEKNSINKSLVRKDRANSLKNIIMRYGREFTDWKGDLVSLTTDSDGNANITIELDDSIIFSAIKKTNHNLDEISFKNITKIREDEKVYKQLSKLERNTRIKFSAEFVVDNTNDYIYEGSTFEKGAMFEPEFEVEFYNINKL